ncbi:hypothetical protein DRN98_00705 [Methanosarcinales archaeon]|nr:MAG: hypothetical protein DRN98_00705 [Methanosarcinales archaeon]
MMERIRTYIGGMDDLLEGGIPAGSVMLICGKPGAMKSSLAYSILYKNVINENREGLYVTLEQTPASMLEQMNALNMPEHKSLTIVSYNDIDDELERSRLDHRLEQNWIKRITNYLENIQHGRKSTLLAIDSLDGLYSLTKVEMPRREIFLFFKTLREMGFTTFLISEMKSDSYFTRCGVEDFLADGIIHLDLEYNSDKNALALKVGVVKMRATNIGRQYFPLIYRDDSFSIITKPTIP